MFGAKITLIVLTGQRLARIDLAGPRRRLRVERVMHCPATASSELAASVAIAYRLGESAGNSRFKLPSRHGQRSLIVLSDDVWHDALSLPLDVTVLLQPAELQQALAIEAENQSGINAFSSRIASRRLVDISSNLLDMSSNYSSTTTWWAAQVAHSDLASMSVAAKACGVRFLGATHPQALWLAERREPMPFVLDDPQSLRQFGDAWAHALSGDGLELLVRPESQQSPQTRITWLQTAAALATTLVCAYAYQSQWSKWQSIVAKTEQYQQSLSDYEATTSQLRSAEAKLQQARQKLSQAEAIRVSQLFVAQGKELNPERSPDADWLSLFNALALHTPDECWIESWRRQDQHTILVGRALTAQAVHELASRLEPTLNQHGWQLNAPLLNQTDQGLLQFQLPLHVDHPTGQQRSWQ